MTKRVTNLPMTRQVSITCAMLRGSQVSLHFEEAQTLIVQLQWSVRALQWCVSTRTVTVAITDDNGVAGEGGRGG